MVVFREQVNQKFSDNEDCCKAYFSARKYSYITCDQPICNRCSKYELNEKKMWLGSKKKHVGSCEQCWNEQREQIGGKEELPRYVYTTAYSNWIFIHIYKYI